MPSDLATSASRSPSRFAYQASLILLGARALFSPLKISDMIDPSVKGTKATFEQHHLFPRGYLSKIGITDLRQVNQIANFALVEWPDNGKISDQPPSAYAPTWHAALTPKGRTDMMRWHALPAEWWNMEYQDFLRERRSLMAKLVHDAYRKLLGDIEPEAAVKLSVQELLSAGETDTVEYKSTLRTNLHTGGVDEKMSLAVLKTLAGFLNAKGGTLMIGVADDGKVVGLSADSFASEDKMALHLVNLIRDRIGDLLLPYIHPHFDEQEGDRVMVVHCEAGPKAAFVKDGAAHRFYVRGANATAELSGNVVTDYVKVRFP